jgi:putative hydrolase of the HAD superfamily
MTALKITQIKPDECVYFDDRPMLVDAAKKIGMNSILHQDFETTKNILENFRRK